MEELVCDLGSVARSLPAMAQDWIVVENNDEFSGDNTVAAMSPYTYGEPYRKSRVTSSLHQWQQTGSVLDIRLPESPWRRQCINLVSHILQRLRTGKLVRCGAKETPTGLVWNQSAKARPAILFS